MAGVHAGVSFHTYTYEMIQSFEKLDDAANTCYQFCITAGSDEKHACCMYQFHEEDDSHNCILAETDGSRAYTDPLIDGDDVHSAYAWEAGKKPFASTMAALRNQKTREVESNWKILPEFMTMMGGSTQYGTQSKYQIDNNFFLAYNLRDDSLNTIQSCYNQCAANHKIDSHNTACQYLEY